MSKRATRRDPQKERYWRGVIGRQRGSGLSVRAYCRREGVRENCFYWWRGEIARRSAEAKKARRALGGDRRNKQATVVGESPSSGAAFLPLKVAAEYSADADAPIEIYLACGRRIGVHPGFDRQMLEEVLAALEGSSC